MEFMEKAIDFTIHNTQSTIDFKIVSNAWLQKLLFNSIPNNKKKWEEESISTKDEEDFNPRV